MRKYILFPSPFSIHGNLCSWNWQQQIVYLSILILAIAISTVKTASNNNTVCVKGCPCYIKEVRGCSENDALLERLISLEDYEDFALEALDKNAKDYYRSGANFEHTLHDNINAFWRYRLRPRILKDVSKRKLCVSVLGSPISFPVGIAPAAAQRMASPEGELGTVKAAADAGTVMILSTLSSTTIEEVAAAAPHGIHWFQLYVFRERWLTRKLVRRAERAGFKALVVTVDTPFFGRRYADVRNNFQLPSHLEFANFDEGDLPKGSLETEGDSVLASVSKLIDPSLTWDSIKWLQSVTKLPVVVKGILTAEDAKMAVEKGCAGIIVSNHGGRQLDTVPATIDALPEVVRAVKGSNVEVYMDGGIRNGTDVFKAIAMGAKAVFVGRPILWGLKVAGQKGARRVLELLRMEFDMAVGLCGLETVNDIKPSYVVRETYYGNLWRPSSLYCPSDRNSM